MNRERMLKIAILFSTLTYSAISCASLPSISPQQLFEQSDLVIVGKPTGEISLSTEGKKAAVVQNLYVIKGEATGNILVCNDSGEEGFAMISRSSGKVFREDTGIYFLKKKDGCHIGAIGYKSLVYLYKQKNCIVTELTYQTEIYQNDLEPIELFIEKLTGRTPDLPSFLKSKEGDCNEKIPKLEFNDCKP